MPKEMKNYNVAAIGENGSTISTQLWDVTDADVPLKTVQKWVQDPYKHLTRSCPVVIAPFSRGKVSNTVFMTVGEVLDFFGEAGPLQHVPDSEYEQR